VTIVGIVKRPYPTATDRRFQLLPRGRADVTGVGAGGSVAGGAGGAAGSGGPGAGSSAAPTGSGGFDVTPDTDLATLAEHVGARVHVGGLVSQLMPDGFLLDDGTAVARLVLHADALVLVDHLRAGDALAAWGTVTRDGDQLSISVASAADVVRIGALGQALPVDPPAPFTSSAGPSPTGPTGHAPSLATAAPGDVLPGEVSLATLAALTAASVLVSIVGRRTASRRSRDLVLARLATLTRRPPA